MSTGRDAETLPDSLEAAYAPQHHNRASFLNGSSQSSQRHVWPGRAIPFLSHTSLSILTPLSILALSSFCVLKHV